MVPTQFIPNNGLGVGGTAPYVYFKAIATQYPGSGQVASWACPLPDGTSATVVPFCDADLSSASNVVWMNPQTYQLLCPGLDGKYGTYNTNNPPDYPTGTRYATTGYSLDDLTNFSQSTLGNDMQR